jgi:hypothetical protein
VKRFHDLVNVGRGLPCAAARDVLAQPSMRPVSGLERAPRYSAMTRRDAVPPA